MHLLEWLLLVHLLAFFPLWELFRSRALRERLETNPEEKVRVYRTICLQLWLPTLLLLTLFGTGSLSVSELPVLTPVGIAQGIALVLLLGFTIFLGIALRRVVRDAGIRQQAAEALADQAWALPVTRPEAAWFIGPVSLSAGICEELLYRAYLIPWLDQALPIWAAVVLSSLVFGLMHAYQGHLGIIRTAAVGLGMALIFLATGSLLVPILLHVVLDAYAGALSWIALRTDESLEAPDPRKERIEQTQPGGLGGDCGHPPSNALSATCGD
ncbi:MAG: CPBP family intramembrane glutamic endopeptidase [Candidatus Wenzhouxiangella sp. M2_3B_020]